MSKAHKFDIYDHDDIHNEMYMIAVDGLEKFDETRGYKLEHFLRVHIRNRISDLRRNKYISGQSKLAEDKLKVISPVSINVLSEDNLVSDSMADNQETFEFIDSRLCARLRRDYLKIKEGISIPFHKKREVLEAIQVIMEGFDD